MDHKQDNVYQIGQGYPLQQGYLQQDYPPQQVNPQQGYPPQQGNQQQQGYPGGVQYNPNSPVTIIAKQSTQPNDYMNLALFVTICCCLPFGIVAIVQATWVRTAV
ncbi:proline-rich transmembrane protein 1-like [Amphiura filiformis]|uniref:proline-rich transmembrane protein 1-like n=1 Tax=Amphiura filiformis TaxID=82378 RepID=UPI003B21FD29